MKCECERSEDGCTVTFRRVRTHVMLAHERGSTPGHPFLALRLAALREMCSAASTVGRVKSPSAVASAALIALLACAAAAYSSDKAASGAWLPAAAVSLVALGLAGASLWSVTEERLSLFREHGVQLESRRFG